MRRRAPRWWRSSGSTCRGSATLSPPSAPSLSRRDRRRLSSFCPSRKSETPASGSSRRQTSDLPPPLEAFYALKPLPRSPGRTLSKTIVKGAKMAGKITMGRGSQTTLKKSDRGSRTWHEEDDISSEKKQKTAPFFFHFHFIPCPPDALVWLCVHMHQYQTTVSRRPAARCERRRSPPWSSWWSSPASGTTSVWAWAPSLQARRAPSPGSSSGSPPSTDSTPCAAGTQLWLMTVLGDFGQKWSPNF